MVIENCRFSTLSSDQEGGALLVSNSSLLIAGSHFEENNAEFGGAPWPVFGEFRRSLVKRGWSTWSTPLVLA